MWRLILFSITFSGTSGLTSQNSPFFTALDVCSRELFIPADRVEQYRLLFFPDDPVTHCTVRCILVQLRAWNDRTGVRHSVLQQFFSPLDPNPTDSYIRVHNCLNQVVSQCPPTDSCAQAYWSLNCYKKQFGNYFFSRDQFVPPTPFELQQSVVDCMDKLDIPRVEVLDFNWWNQTAVRFPCAGRCFLQASDLFDDRAGLVWDRLYVAFGRQEQRETFLERLYHLVEEVRTSAARSPCDVANQMIKPLQEYLLPIFGLTYLSGVHLQYDLKIV